MIVLKLLMDHIRLMLSRTSLYCEIMNVIDAIIALSILGPPKRQLVRAGYQAEMIAIIVLTEFTLGFLLVWSIRSILNKHYFYSEVARK